MSQSTIEAPEQASLTCVRCGEEPATGFVDGRAICDECRSSPVASVIGALDAHPVLRELALFVAVTAGVSALYSGAIGAAGLAAVVAAVVLTVPRLARIVDGDGGGPE